MVSCLTMTTCAGPPLSCDQPQCVLCTVAPSPMSWLALLKVVCAYRDDKERKVEEAKASEWLFPLQRVPLCAAALAVSTLSSARPQQ